MGVGVGTVTGHRLFSPSPSPSPLVLSPGPVGAGERCLALCLLIQVGREVERLSCLVGTGARICSYVEESQRESLALISPLGQIMSYMPLNSFPLPFCFVDLVVEVGKSCFNNIPSLRDAMRHHASKS